MAIKIRFDQNHNAEQPTFVLMTRTGKKLGKLPISHLQFTDTMNSYSQARFDVYKNSVPSGEIEKETVTITGFNISGEVTSDTGRGRIGQLPENKYSELARYFSDVDRITNPYARIRKDRASLKYEDISLSMDETTLVIKDSSNNNLFEISDAGTLYFYNSNTSTYSSGDVLQFEFYFDVPLSHSQNDLWELLTDFKLIWAKEWNAVFEISVETEDGDGIVKNVTATSLGEAELSQINLYEIEINTENDIARDDYVPTVLFDELHSNASLLNRIMEKAPHYKIAHVDSSIASIQRQFQFDKKSLYDAFQEIANEINCIFVPKCYLDDNGDIVREISVYDLESYCVACGHRGEFTKTCEKCGSTHILHGYGEDTTIYITSENLADNITFTTDTSSVKNCFLMSAGDDLMTATIKNCNPNGSSYLWYISDEVKADMPKALADKINEYDANYDFYQNSYVSRLDTNLVSRYNSLINKYKAYTTDYSNISANITGYPALMQAYYDSLDFYLYLHDSLMPGVEIQNTTAGLQGAKIGHATLSPVAVQNLNTCSETTAKNAVLQMAKTLVDPNYQVTVKDSAYSNHVWTGSFVVTSYSDEEDTYTTRSINVDINDNYEKYVKQRIDKLLANKSEDITDIVTLLKAETQTFKNELKKYSLTALSEIHEVCQSCINVLIEQGIADKKTWANKNPDLYTSLYLVYYNKLDLIAKEIQLREQEINLVTGVYNDDGELVTSGIQSEIISFRDLIQDQLNFEKYLGEDLWLDFLSYRREDTYSNSNYISDGLNNAELIENALEFIEVAKKEVFKSATLQHSISASLRNLLVMKEFEPLLQYFEKGNWLRIKVDEKVYQLRLLEYSIDYDKLDSLSVDFSDVKIIQNGLSDLQSVLNNAASMASSYGSVTRQASQGKKANKQISDWVNKSLSLTLMKIVDNADDQNIELDSHGLLCRQYLPITDSYDDCQLKIINKGLYVTEDNWKTASAGIGAFTFWNPETREIEDAYGVIAKTVVGSLLLGERFGIYNDGGSVQITENGLSVSNDTNSVVINPNADSIINVSKNDTPLFYLDTNGNLNISGNITATSLTLGNNVKVPYDSLSGVPDLTIYIAKDGSVGNTPGPDKTGFLVKSSGALTASNAIIYGTIYASAGKIGGFDIASNSIHTADVAVTNNADNSVALSSSTFTRTINGTSRSSLKFAIGSNFGVKNDGTIYAGNAVISGAITATSLTLGSGVTVPYSSVSGTPTELVYIRSDGTIGKGTVSSGANAFEITKEGLIKASNAVIYGTIYASAGKIAGWTIDSTSIYKGSADDGYQAWLYAPASMSSTALAFRVRTYANNAWTNQFYVRYDGYMYARNANISGTITAGSGSKIAGWNISDTKIYKETTISGSTYQAYMQAPDSPTANNACFGLSKTTSGTTTYPFWVGYDGTLHSTNADLSGSFVNKTATSTVYMKDGVIQIDRDASLSDLSWNGMWLRYVQNGETLRQSALRPNSLDIIDYDNWNYEFYAAPSGVGIRNLSTNTWKAGFNVNTRPDGDSVFFADYITYTYSCYETSDRRLKENITPIEAHDAEQRIMNWVPVRYKYLNTNGYHHGFIAQNIEENKYDYDWEVVSENEMTGYKSLAYTELIADLVATVKDLHQRIEALEARL